MWRRPRSWDSQGHFFGAAAEAMRRILVEKARRKMAHKRGGDYRRVDLDGSAMIAPESEVDLVALDDALTALGKTDARAAQLVQLRYFAGLTIPEAAEVLGVSPFSLRN